jgi:hypothetical protein
MVGTGMGMADDELRKWPAGRIFCHRITVQVVDTRYMRDASMEFGEPNVGSCQIAVLRSCEQKTNYKFHLEINFIL